MNKFSYQKGVTKEQALKNRAIAKQRIGKAIQGVKNYGKNVAGGAKIVGSAVKNKVLKAFKR